MSYNRLKQIIEATFNKTLDKLDTDKLYKMWYQMNHDLNYDISYYLHDNMSDEDMEIMYEQTKSYLLKNPTLLRKLTGKLMNNPSYRLDIEDVMSDIREEISDGTLYLYDPAGEALASTEKFKEFTLNNNILPTIESLTGDIKRTLHDGGITLYRLQQFKPAERASVEQYAGDYVTHLLNFGGRLGKHWTNNVGSVPNFMDTLKQGTEFNEDDYLLEIFVKDEYIDWMDTIRARMNYEFGELAYEDYQENEVVLFKNTPVKILNISQYSTDEDDFIPVPDDEDLKKLRNKVFYV